MHVDIFYRKILRYKESWIKCLKVSKINIEKGIKL